MSDLILKNGAAVHIDFLEFATTNWADDVTALSRQLRNKCVAALGRDGLLRLITQHCFLAVRADYEASYEFSGKVVGMAVLVSFAAPTGKHGHIVDPVISPDFACQGAEAIMASKLVTRAQQLNLEMLSLASGNASSEFVLAFSQAGFRRSASQLFTMDL
jgi:hypothetical protein